MQIKVTIEIPDEPFQGLPEGIWSLIGGASRPANTPESPVSAPVAEAPAKRTRKPKEEVVATSTVSEVTMGVEAAGASDDESPEAPPTVEDVLKRAADFMKDTKDGAAIVSNILKDMGFKKVREIPVDALPTFLAKLAAA